MRKKLIVGGILLVLVVGAFFVMHKSQKPELAHDCLSLQGKTCNVKLEYAKDQLARQNGLSGRDKLDEGKGMMFVFDNIQEQCIWMKDMKFNIDVVWISDAKTITHIEKNVSPSTYPKSFCYKSKYVLELPAGVADNLNLKDYQKLAFKTD